MRSPPNKRSRAAGEGVSAWVAPIRRCLTMTTVQITRGLSEDLASTLFVYKNFAARVPEGTGLDLEPDLDKLKQYRRAS
jgi:hypothetical protein